MVVRRADRGLIDGRHVGNGVVRVDAAGAGITVVARGGGCSRGREITVADRRGAVDVGRTVREHVGSRDQGNGRGDLTANDRPAVAVTGSATHGSADAGGVGLLAARCEGANERHFNRPVLLGGAVVSVWCLSEERYSKDVTSRVTGDCGVSVVKT